MSRALAAFASLVLVVSTALGVAAGPASATSTLLCKGYTGCANLAMSNAGYKAVSGTMWWRMYSGHNCTNYAAYRMVKSGLPNTRPWSGSGNASNWGHAMARLTNAVPAVGAVAWWDAYVRPAGSAGHVAYVEQVISANEIVVSQDSWGGDFSWARITRVGGSWPSGFIHFNDVPLRNTAVPAVSGTAKVGSTLSASSGAWTPTAPLVSYQWRADGVAIANATSPTLTLGLGQEGKKISVVVTASKVGYPTTSASSVPTATVEPGSITNTTLPSVSGPTVVDATLTALPGAWTPAATTPTYQWLADGAPVKGATAATLAVTPALVGKTVTVRVTATKTGYVAVSATSRAGSPVRPATFETTGTPTVTGIPRSGQTLTLTPATYRPESAAVSYQWLRAGVVIPDATGPTYDLGTADLGARIRGRVTLTKPGYTTSTTTTAPTAYVRSVSTLRVAASQPSHGTLALTVQAAAAGVTPPTGTVRVRSNGRILRETVLQGGSAAVTLRGLPTGSQTFRVVYLGSPSTTWTRVDRRISIR